MSDPAATILGLLQRVEREREARVREAGLGERVTALKRWQQQRFAATYADLIADERYAGVARFFLDELYGPRDFHERDAQFARVVPTLVRLFPEEIVATVETLARLHALSEELDSEMARYLLDASISLDDYRRAWQATGRADDRERQIALTLEVGAALDRYTRRRVLRHSLKLMRAPARAAGLEGLQHFLETGFEAFGAMHGADDFLALVGARERDLAARLYAPAVP